MRKQHFLILTTLAFGLLACNKEQDMAKDTPVTVFKASQEMVAFDGETKSTMSDLGAFVWSTDDAIKAFNGSSWSTSLGISGIDGASANFTMSGTGFQSAAVFPASVGAAINGADLTLTLPSEINYTEDEADNIMLATADFTNLNLSFKNVGGVIKITLNNMPAGAKKVLFTTGKNISGEFTIADFATVENPQIEATAGSAGVTFVFETALSGGENKVFYVPVPVGTYPSIGFNVLSAGDESLWALNASVENEVTRRRLLIMPELTRAGGSGDPGQLSVVVPANYSGTFVLPRTTSPVNVTINNTEGTVLLAYDGDDPSFKPAEVSINIAGESVVSTLGLDLPLSTVTVNGHSASNIGTLNAVTAAATLHVLDSPLTIGQAVIQQGNALIEGKVQQIEVAQGASSDGEGSPVQLLLSETAKVNQMQISAPSEVNIEKPQDSSSSDVKTIDVTVTETAGGSTLSVGENVIVNLDAQAQTGVETAVAGTGDEDGIVIPVNPESESHTVPKALTDIKKTFALGGSFILEKDLVLDEALIVEEDKQVILDLNGHVLSYDGTSTITGGLLQVKRGAELIINDASKTGNYKVGTGRIDASTAKTYAALQVTVKGDNADKQAVLTVNNTNLIGYYYAITGNGNRHNTDVTVFASNLSGTCPGDNLGIYHPQNGTLTIKGDATTITGYSSGIEMRAGTLTVSSSAVITATAEEFSATPNGSGTTIVGAAIAASQHNTNLPISISLASNKLYGYYSLYEDDVQDPITDNVSLEIKSGTYYGRIYSRHCTGFIAAGQYAYDPTPYLKDETWAVPGSTLAYKVEKYVTNNNVTQASDIGTSLGTSGKYTLGADLAATFVSGTFSSAVVTINLNDHSITTNDANRAAFLLRGTNKLILDGEGAVSNTSGESPVIWTSKQENEVTINGGVYDAFGHSESIYCEKGVITINGGTFLSTGCDDHRYLLNCKDANYIAGSATIIVKGGTFWDFDPSNCQAEGAGTNFVADGYVVVADSDSQQGHILYTVKPE